MVQHELCLADGHTVHHDSSSNSNYFEFTGSKLLANQMRNRGGIAEQKYKQKVNLVTTPCDAGHISPIHCTSDGSSFSPPTSPANVADAKAPKGTASHGTRGCIAAGTHNVPKGTFVGMSGRRAKSRPIGRSWHCLDGQELVRQGSILRVVL